MRHPSLRMERSLILFICIHYQLCSNTLRSAKFLFQYLVGCCNLLAIDSECHQAGGQVYQTAYLQVHVAATRGVSSVRHIATPHHVAVAPLHAIRVRISVIQLVLT